MARPDWTSPGFWLPQHPFWTPLGAALFSLARTLGYPGGPLELIQALNALVGGGAVYAFYRVVREAGADGPPALAATALLAGSFGFWTYSGDVKMYPFPVLLLFLALAGALRLARQGRADPGPAAGVGALLALAMLFHVTVLYAVPAVALAAALGPRGPRRTAMVLGAFGGVLLVGWWLAFLPASARFGGTFWQWLTFPATTDAPWVLYRGPLEARLALFAQRFPSSIAGSGWTGFITHTWPGPEPAWHAALERTAALFAPTFLAAWALALAAHPRRLRSPGAAVLLLWLAASVAGFAILTADNNLVYLILAPVAGLAALAASGSPRGVGALAATAGVLFALNLALRILPAALPENNRFLTDALEARAWVGRDDVVVTFIDNGYYEYFARVPTLALFRFFQDHWQDQPYLRLAEVLDRVQGQGGRAWLTASTVRDPFQTNPPPERMGLVKEEALAFFRERYELVPVPPEGAPLLYRLERRVTSPRSTRPAATGTSRSSTVP